MFDIVLNAPLAQVLLFRSSQIEFLPRYWQMIDLLDWINLAIYMTLHQVTSQGPLKFTWMEIYHLILLITYNHIFSKQRYKG